MSVRPVGAALFLAIVAASAASAAEPPQFRSAGVANGECRSGMRIGLASIVRWLVSCQISIARGVDLAAPDVEGQFRRVTTTRVGRTDIHSVTDELLQAWVKDPTTSLAPRPEFRPERVENLEFAEAAGFDRYMNATGGLGLTMRETTGVVLRGRLIAETGNGPAAFDFSGRMVVERGGWKLDALEIGPALAPTDASAVDGQAAR